MPDMEVEFSALVGGSQKGSLDGSGSVEVKGAPFLQVKSVDEKARAITALASNDALDRHGEIILPSAFTKYLPRYLANPVFIASHCHRLADGRSPVIGSAAKAWVDKAGLWVVMKFAETELGEEYWQLYRTKHQRALSVGFIPHEYEYREVEGVQRQVFTVVELLEISAVAVPSNPEALSRAAQRRQDFVGAKRAARAPKAAGEQIDSEEAEFGQWQKEFEEWSESAEGQEYWEKSSAALMADDDEFEGLTCEQRSFPDFEQWLAKQGGGDNDYEKAVRGDGAPGAAVQCDAGGGMDTGDGMDFVALVSGQ